MKKRRILGICLSVATAISAGAAESVAEQWDTVSTTLPELNIVAIKQPGNPDSQALSATTLNTQAVVQNGIHDIKNISDLVPNFYIPDYGSRITSSIYVRGIGARMDQPSVGLTIDNLPVMNKDAYDLDIADIAEVEMLRGPQSSLFGRNTMCGLINIRTFSPMKYQGVRLKGEFDSRLNLRLSGGWYHKFNPKAGLSAILGFNSIHGDHTNLYNGKAVGNEKSGNLRLKFEWLPTDRLSVLNTFSTSLLRQSGYAYENVNSHEINYNDTCFYRRFLLSDVLTLNYDFERWRLSGILSVQHINDNLTLDQDFLPASYFTLSQKKQETDLTAEVIARGKNTGRYNWLAGFFSFYRHLDMQAPVRFKDAGIYHLIESHRNDANPYYPIKWDTDNFLLGSNFALPSFGFAIYHESRLKAGKWEFTGAVRLDYERVTLRYRSDTNTSYTIYENPSGSLDTPFSDMKPFRRNEIEIHDRGTLHTHFMTFLPQVSALFNLPSDIGNVYASFGKGYKAGGFNTQMFSDVLQQRLMGEMGIGAGYDVDKIVKYKPEYSYNYEIGAHLELASCSSSSLSDLTVDVSLFYIDCRDQQLTMFPEGNTTGRIMTNAGKTRSFGGELSLCWNPWEPLVLNANYGFTNARFLKFFDGKESYAGKVVPYAPQNTLFIQGLYTMRSTLLRKNAIVFDANLRGTGEIYWNEGNTLKQPFYVLLGASVTFRAPKWEVQVWGRNLTNTDYDTFYFMSIGNEFVQKGHKISAGLTLRINI